jgi:proteasome lid subunit RPN8/RPN11
MISTLVLPPRLHAQLENAARAAFPRECCGLVEGSISGSIANAAALHPTRNLSAEADRFEIDPAVHFNLLRRLREAQQQIIGCYHSHPNGRSEPSARDRVGAAEAGFLWLIAALDADRSKRPRIAAFVSTGGAFADVHIASLDRAAAPPV